MVYDEMIEELKENAELRSRLYWLLSRLYLERPTYQFLLSLKEKLNEIEDSSEGVELIRESLKGELQELSERLGVEFTRLFRGIKEGYGPPPPYESVYMGEGRVMGETTLVVLRFYTESGLGLMEDIEDPQDYIGAELRFMSLLIYRELEGWETGKKREAFNTMKREKEFLEKHMLRWVPKFCELVEGESGEDFYRGVAVLTKEFLTSDYDYLSEVISELSAL